MDCAVKSDGVVSRVPEKAFDDSEALFVEADKMDMLPALRRS